jgi:hypothetical protein
VQSAYYHRDGRPQESSNRQEVHWGNNSTLQTGTPEDDLSIQTDEHTGTQYLKDDQEPSTFNITKSPDDDLAMDRVADKPPVALDDDMASILTSAMQQSNAQKR